MHIERRTKSRTDNIVYARVVRVIGEVKAFRSEQQVRILAQFERAAEAQVKVRVARTDSRVPSGARRPVIGEMTIAVDVRSGQKIERMAAVVAEDRCQLEAAEDLRLLQGTLKDSGNHDLVALIEIRQGIIAAQAGGIKRRIVAVKVGRVVGCAAVSVIRQDREVVGEVLLEFKKAALVQRRSSGTVDVVLQDNVRGVGEA